MAAASWSDLPPELIVAISKSLTRISDYLRLRSVCSSWRSATCPSPDHLPLQSPWLAFPSSIELSNHFNFFTFPNSNTIQTLPLPRNPNFLGSSDGFLIIQSKSQISAYNPITCSEINLPFVKTFPMAPFFIKKITLSPPPFSTAMALLSCSMQLALSRPGDDSWALIQGISNYHDALFFDGRFHVVDGFRRIFAIDGGGSMMEIARVRVSRMPPFLRRGEKCYLAEFGAELLLVVRHFNSVCVEGKRGAVVTSGFEVFRVEVGNSVEVKSLGNGVMFLGLNRSIVILDEECPGFRGNCIYFLDDRLNSMGDVAQSGGGDAGVFDMSDGSIQPLPYGIVGLGLGRRPAVWFTPSIC